MFVLGCGRFPTFSWPFSARAPPSKRGACHALCWVILPVHVLRGAMRTIHAVLHFAPAESSVGSLSESQRITSWVNPRMELWCGGTLLGSGPVPPVVDSVGIAWCEAKSSRNEDFSMGDLGIWFNRNGDFINTYGHLNPTGYIFLSQVSVFFRVVRITDRM
jgi:hypothetical protein